MTEGVSQDSPTGGDDDIARALFNPLLSEARAAGYTTVRLETMSFMSEAHAPYRSTGAWEIDPFDGSEAGSVGLAGATTYLEVRL